MAWIQLSKTKELLTVTAGGAWKATDVRDVEAALQALDISRIKKCLFDVQTIEAVDISGAWLIRRFLDRLRYKKIPISIAGASEALKSLLGEIEKFQIERPAPLPQPYAFAKWLHELGETTVTGTRTAIMLISFLGMTVTCLGKNIMSPGRFRYISIFSFIEKAGINALPIVGLISFLIGMVLVYQSAFQLRRFGAEIYAVDLLAISMLREIGILLAAIVVAGRSGSAFTAQIGTMKLNQEVDALLTFGIDPVEVLVLPRLIALIIAFPLLAFYADIMGLVGGAFMAHFSLELSYSQFLHQLEFAIWPRTFWTGMAKAPIFAFIIALVGCFEGMRVTGGAESVGRQTTRSVVVSIFLIIVFDAAFSILFTYLGI